MPLSGVCIGQSEHPQFAGLGPRRKSELVRQWGDTPQGRILVQPTRQAPVLYAVALRVA
jgi:hypothetical protein